MTLMQHDEPIVAPSALFPFRPADQQADGGPARPFGAALATPPTPCPDGEVVELGYSVEDQVATVNGEKAVTSRYGRRLVAKKGNTVHDSVTDVEELTQ